MRSVSCGRGAYEGCDLVRCPPGDVDELHAGQLAHPRQLAARVVAGALLHCADVVVKQLLEAKRDACRRRRAGLVRLSYLVPGAGRDHRVDALLDAPVELLAIAD